MDRAASGTYRHREPFPRAEALVRCSGAIGPVRVGRVDLAEDGELVGTLTPLTSLARSPQRLLLGPKAEESVAATDLFENGHF